MKKLFFLMVGVTLCVFIASTCFASPSAKFTAYVTDLVFSSTDSDSATLSANIKVGSKKDLLIGASLQTSIFTKTVVKGKSGESVMESATGKITVDIELWKDGVEVLGKVMPESVIYDSRTQTLTAVLGGVVDSCEDTGTWHFEDNTGTLDPNDKICMETLYDNCDDKNSGSVSCPDGNVTIPCECYFTDEEIGLILDTMGAHHFNFVAKDLEAGEYEVRIIVTGSTIDKDDDYNDATVAVGPGCLTVEEVRATNNPNGIVFD